MTEVISRLISILDTYNSHVPLDVLQEISINTRKRYMRDVYNQLLYYNIPENISRLSGYRVYKTLVKALRLMIRIYANTNIITIEQINKLKDYWDVLYMYINERLPMFWVILEIEYILDTYEDIRDAFSVEVPGG